MQMMSWNIHAGGFYDYDPEAVSPEREAAILSVIDAQRIKHKVRAVTLTDAYRWDEIYDGEMGIAAHLGYTSAQFVRLEDKRLEQKHGPGIGITFATDEKVATAGVLDLETRNALSVILDVGRHGLQVASVYLDDLFEDVRLTQVKALLGQLKPDMPTLITGDLNALRPHLKEAALRYRCGDLLVRAAGVMLRPSTPLGQTIRGMNRRNVIDHLRAQGYQDGDPLKRPTAPARLPVFGIDYAFHSPEVRVTDFNVLGGQSTRAASDHLPIRYDVHTD